MRKSLFLIAALCLITGYSRGNIAMGSKNTPTSVTTTIHGLGPDTVPNIGSKAISLARTRMAWTP